MIMISRQSSYSSAPNYDALEQQLVSMQHRKVRLRLVHSPYFAQSAACVTRLQQADHQDNRLQRNLS
jgi:hypothetical protein